MENSSVFPKQEKKFFNRMEFQELLQRNVLTLENHLIGLRSMTKGHLDTNILLAENGQFKHPMAVRHVFALRIQIDMIDLALENLRRDDPICDKIEALKIKIVQGEADIDRLTKLALSTTENLPNNP